MPAVSLGDLNPVKDASFFNMGALASGLLIFGIVVVVVVLIGLWIFVKYINKQFNIRIRLFKLVGNVPTQIGLFPCRELAIGMAGDKLWRVAPNGMIAKAFKVMKWLPVGKKQSAPHEFWYWIREDGEWINFIMDDIDAISLKMNVKFVQEDMRLQRLATDRLLEQRLMAKTFWEKWGNTIMTIIFFLVLAVCMVIIFYQWSKLIDKMSPLVDHLTRSLSIVEKTCGWDYNSTSGGYQGLVPA